MCTALEIASRPAFLRLARALLSVILHNGNTSRGHVVNCTCQLCISATKTGPFFLAENQSTVKTCKVFKTEFSWRNNPMFGHNLDENNSLDMDSII